MNKKASETRTAVKIIDYEKGMDVTVVAKIKKTILDKIIKDIKDKMKKVPDIFAQNDPSVKKDDVGKTIKKQSQFMEYYGIEEGMNVLSSSGFIDEIANDILNILGRRICIKHNIYSIDKRYFEVNAHFYLTDGIKDPNMGSGTFLNYMFNDEYHRPSKVYVSLNDLLSVGNYYVKSKTDNKIVLDYDVDHFDSLEDYDIDPEKFLSICDSLNGTRSAEGRVPFGQKYENEGSLLESNTAVIYYSLEDQYNIGTYNNAIDITFDDIINNVYDLIHGIYENNEVNDIVYNQSFIINTFSEVFDRSRNEIKIALDNDRLNLNEYQSLHFPQEVLIDNLDECSLSNNLWFGYSNGVVYPFSNDLSEDSDMIHDDNEEMEKLEMGKYHMKPVSYVNNRQYNSEDKKFVDSSNDHPLIIQVSNAKSYLLELLDDLIKLHNASLRSLSYIKTDDVLNYHGEDCIINPETDFEYMICAYEKIVYLKIRKLQEMKQFLKDLK